MNLHAAVGPAPAPALLFSRRAIRPVSVTVAVTDDGDGHARETLAVSGPTSTEQAFEVPPGGETELTVDVPAPEGERQFQLAAVVGDLRDTVTLEADTPGSGDDNDDSAGGDGSGGNDGFGAGFGPFVILAELGFVGLFARRNGT